MTFEGYRAAGILPLAKNNNQVFVLLGSEPRKKHEPQGDDWWLAFGGKIEQNDQCDPWKTATREFHEETGNFWKQDPQPLNSMYDTKAKFVLYLATIPWTQELPTFTPEQVSTTPTLGKRQLKWFNIEQLLDVLWQREYSIDGHPLKPWFARFLHRERRKIEMNKN